MLIGTDIGGTFTDIVFLKHGAEDYRIPQTSRQ